MMIGTILGVVAAVTIRMIVERREADYLEQDFWTESALLQAS